MCVENFTIDWAGKGTKDFFAFTKLEEIIMLGKGFVSKNLSFELEKNFPTRYEKLLPVPYLNVLDQKYSEFHINEFL